MVSEAPEKTECRYNLATNHAINISHEVLDKIQALDLNANPIHFTLLYEQISQINPELATQIQHTIEMGDYDDNSARMLFNTLWSEIIFNSMHSEEFLNAINELVLFLDEWTHKSETENTQFYNQVEQMAQTKDAFIALTQLQTKIIPALKQRHEENLQFLSQVRQSSSEIKRLEDELKRATSIAKTDELTNIPNRRGFNEMIEESIAKAEAVQATFALVLIDIDHFKSINDNYGHLVGDSILRYLAKVLNNETKGRDSVARIGGEEFAIILPETAYDQSIKLSNSIREKVASRPLSVKGKGKAAIRMTVSAGVAMYQFGEPIEKLFDRADQCLYKAKNHGRNRVVGEAAL